MNALEIVQAIVERDPQRPFSSRVTYGQLFCLARKLLQNMEGLDGPVCLASSDRVLCAAACLASLAGGRELVLPHGFSERVLAETRDAVPYVAILGPNAEVTRDVRVLEIPGQAAPADSCTLEPVRKDDEPMVHLFTGGSTGKPRVWTKTVANIMGEAWYMSRRFSFEPDDVVLATVPPVHIYGLLFSVLAPLLAGAQVVNKTVFMPAEIVQVLARQRVSVFVSGPAHYRALRQGKLEAPALRLATSSGGMLDQADAERFFNDSGVGVVDIFGSTETGGIATRPRSQGGESWIALDVVNWKILGDRLYVNSPFLSPKLHLDEDAFFLTSDRVHAAGAGKFFLLGRADGVVKVAGKRVDLLEVEQKIRSLDFVWDAHVLALDSKVRGSEIVALVVMDCTTDDLRARLENILESQAIPRRMLKVRQIPRTETGKPHREEILKIIHT